MQTNLHWRRNLLIQFFFCFSFHFIRSFFLYGLFIFFSSFSLLSLPLFLGLVVVFVRRLRSRFSSVAVSISPFAFFFSSSSSLACTRTESRRIVDDALYDRFFFSFSLLSSSICLTHRKERKGICRGKKITTSFNANGT